MKFEKREQSEGSYGLKVGLAEFKVVAVSPTMDELKKILNTDKLEKEPVYLAEKDDKAKVTIVFWIEDIKTGQKYPYRFNIIDEVKVWEKSGKTVWVNQTGSSATVSNESDLQQWFTHFQDKEKKVTGEKEYRKALNGESELYEFLRNWMSNVNWFSPNTNVLQDTKKLFRGNVKELQSMVGDELTGTVVLALYVAMVEKDGEKKFYQNIWRDSQPGYMMKKNNLSIQQNSWDSDKKTKEFKDKLIGEHGITAKGANAFVLDHLQEFDENGHQNMGDEVLKKDASAAEDMDY